MRNQKLAPPSLLLTPPTTAALATLLLAFTGCSAEPPSASGDWLRTAKPVPVVTAQALALVASLKQQPLAGRLSKGQSAPHLTTLLAEDFDGHPFVYLNFTTPSAVPEPLRYGLDPLPLAAGSYSTSINGASSARSVQSMTSTDVRVLKRLALTAEGLGGAALVKRVVAAAPTVILLQDQQGRYWDVESGAQLTDEALQALRQEYAAVRDHNQDPQVLQTLSASWGDMLDAGAGERAQLTREDGSLDVARALQSLDDQRAAAPAAYSISKSCYRVLFWTECTRHEYGSMPARRQAHRAIQNQKGDFQTIPNCIGGGYVRETWMGCGPAAFISLVWREWADGQRFYSRSFQPESYDAWDYGISSIAHRMASELPGLMGSCVLGGGTMTLPTNLQSGGNRWLAQQGSSLRLQAIIAPFGWRGPEMAQVLFSQIGLEGRPVVAQFRVGAFAYHYSPVSEYHVTSSPWVYDVSVKGFDEGSNTNEWHSVTDHWALVTSMFYLR